MKKFCVFLLLLFVFISRPVIAATDNNAQKSIIIKNRMFSITIPAELKGFYKCEIKKDKISVYDKVSRKAGFGGFAFGIKAYKNPADHATLPGGKKVGELVSKNGTLFDVVLKYPTDVQYDYTISSVPPKSYKLLYDIGESVSIEGVKGYQYYKNQGMKGKDLYHEVLKSHINAINEKYDSIMLEQNNMSYMYNILRKSGENLLNKIGYAYYDLNADGIDELLIGEISKGNQKGIIYDIYTMVNREPKHVVSGGNRNRFFVCNDVFLCNEYSSGAMENGVRVYILLENSTELFPQVAFKYDGYSNVQNPWFLSYGIEEESNKWENVTESTYKERKKIFDRYKRFDFVPLSQIKF